MPKKYHDWVYMADDSMNKTLKTIIVVVYCYGAYQIGRAHVRTPVTA